MILIQILWIVRKNEIIHFDLRRLQNELYEDDASQNILSNFCEQFKVFLLISWAEGYFFKTFTIIIIMLKNAIADIQLLCNTLYFIHTESKIKRTEQTNVIEALMNKWSRRDVVKLETRYYLFIEAQEMFLLFYFRHWCDRCQLMYVIWHSAVQTSRF